MNLSERIVNRVKITNGTAAVSVEMRSGRKSVTGATWEGRTYSMKRKSEDLLMLFSKPASYGVLEYFVRRKTAAAYLYAAVFCFSYEIFLIFIFLFVLSVKQANLQPLGELRSGCFEPICSVFPTFST